MPISPEARLLLREIIARELPVFVGPMGEIDRDKVTSAIVASIHVEHPWAQAEIAAAAEWDFIRTQLDHWLRHSKSSFATTDRENREAVKRGKWLREYVTFPAADGHNVTKRRLNLTRADLGLYRQTLVKQRDAFQREIAWVDEVFHQMQFLGLAEDAPVSLIVNQEAA